MCGVLGWPCLPCPLYCQPAPARLNAAAPRLPNLASHLCPLVLVVLGVVLSVWGLAGIGPPFYAPPPSAPLPALTGTAPRRWGARAQGPWGAYAAAPASRFVVLGVSLSLRVGAKEGWRGQAGGSCAGGGRQAAGKAGRAVAVWKSVEFVGCGKLWNVESCGM